MFLARDKVGSYITAESIDSTFVETEALRLFRYTMFWLPLVDLESSTLPQLLQTNMSVLDSRFSLGVIRLLQFMQKRRADIFLGEISSPCSKPAA